jgi:hypothetical protein
MCNSLQHLKPFQLRFDRPVFWSRLVCTSMGSNAKHIGVVAGVVEADGWPVNKYLNRIQGVA